MWQKISAALNTEITPRKSPEFYKAGRAALKERLGSFWYVAWVLIGANILLQEISGSLSL
ncbi:MAG: hypothetical protein ACHQ51_15230 [Elusimicrobiota bacterium]